MIVVTTPTGQIGSRVVEYLAGRGETVRVIARDPAKLEPQVRERTDVVQGSSDDPGVVTAALDGADAVLWVVPPNPSAMDVELYYLDFTRPLCDAIRTQGVRRVVGVTSLGRNYPGAAGNLSAAFAMDDLIEDTGVSYRALAMPYFLDNLLDQVDAIAQGIIAMPNAATRPLASVATRDVAAVAADLLLDGSWIGQESVPVIGPDDLTPDAMAQVISETLERPVAYRQVPAENHLDTLTGYGMTKAWAQGLIDMATAQDDGIYDAEKAIAPPQPTGLRQWCKAVLAPAVLARVDPP